MVRLALIVVILLSGSSLLFGQLLEFKEPTKLPGTINSSAEEGMPLLSPDGNKLFFSRALSDDNHGGQYAGQDIWFSEKSSTGWKSATNALGSINNKNNNVVAGISQDGKSLYFVDASPFQKMNGIYVTHQLNNNAWSQPELIFIPGLDNQDFIGFYVSPDLDVIFLSMKTNDNKGNEDLYYSVKESTGFWTKPKTLGATINTSGFEIGPFLSADKRRLYFASNGHGGSGDADIFYSERLYDSWETWTLPVNLGSPVNSEKFDAYFSIYGDSVAYFASNRDGRYADLYRTRILKRKTILERGQQYLTSDEWNVTVGKNVTHTLTFPKMNSKLTPAQQELVFYIVNKLMLERDIRFHLVVREEEDKEMTKERLRSIFDALKRSGIDPTRIEDEQVSEISKSDKGVIEILLYR
jgi:hypothetical protein